MLFPRTITEDPNEENYNTFNNDKVKVILDEDEIAGSDQTFHNSKVREQPRTWQNNQINKSNEVKSQQEIQIPEKQISNSTSQDKLSQLMRESTQKQQHPLLKQNSIEKRESKELNHPEKVAENKFLQQDKQRMGDSKMKFPPVGKSQNNDLNRSQQKQQQQQQQSVQQKSPLCSTHVKEILFVCCVSQWHCEALCIDCVPEHTDQHNKNRTQPALKKLDLIKQECSEKCTLLYGELNKYKEYIEHLQNEEYSDQNLVNIQMWKIQLTNVIESYFIQLEDDYRQKIISVNQQYLTKLEMVLNEVDKVQNDLYSFQNDLNNTQFYLKGIANTMRLNVEIFVKDLDEELKRIKTSNLVKEEVKLNQSLVKYIQENIGRLVVYEQVKTQGPANKKGPDYKNVKTKSNICPECGEKMVYVSSFKKHMECPNCGKSKRPNQ